MIFKKTMLLVVLSSNFIIGIEARNINGKVVDSKTKEPLIGANVLIVGTTKGAATDVSGKFLIQNLSEDVFDINATYIGYKSKTVTNLSFSELDNFVIELDSDVISVSAVQVQAEKKIGGEASAIASKQNAIEMQDNISSDQISKTGDSHVADAVRRVTGVTIMNDKFLVVRGLGDRYSSAQMNSVGMPSPEADKRSVPLDLFSTALISGIDVAKSYRPDLPGAFGGGNVNIKTKLYPSKTIYKVKIGSGLSGNVLPGDDIRTNSPEQNSILGFDVDQSRGLPNSFENELISYGSIPDTFRTNLMTPIVSSFTGDTIGWNSSPERYFSWYQKAYEKNSLLPNNFKNSVTQAKLPTNTSLTYGTKYDMGDDFELGFIADGSYSSKQKYNEERMDRYVAFNDPSDPGTISIGSDGDTSTIYNKLLRPGFVGLDRNIYEKSTNMGVNFSFGLTFREKLRFGFRNVYTHTSKDNFTQATGLSGELTYDYKDLHPGEDFSLFFLENGDSYTGENWEDLNSNGLYDIGEEFTDNNNNNNWDPGDPISFLDESGLLISQRYNEKSINLSTFSIENKFKYLVDNQIDLKYTIGRSKMFEPFANKSEWEYKRDTLNPYTGVYDLYLRNGSDPGVSYNSNGAEEIFGFSWDHTIKTEQYGEFKYGIKLDSKKRDFKRRYLYLDYSDFSMKNDDSITTSGLEDLNGALGDSYWATSNDSLGLINEGLFYSEKTSGFDAYKANEKIEAAYIMHNFKWNGKLQISVGGRWENYSMNMDPYHPVLKYKPYTLVANGTYDETETFEDLNGDNSWNEGEPFIDEMDTSIIAFKNASNNFLPAIIANYNLTEKSKIRTSFSKTLARAQFREYAPYVFQEFLGADETIGYPHLKNSTIQSSDIRYEYYPKGIELISLGVFQKHFKNPIEESLIASSGLSYTKSWQNGEYANIYGLEAEIRKGINFIPAKYGFLTLNSNMSLSQSEVVLPDSVFIYNAALNAETGFGNLVDSDSGKRSRPLQGQSNIVFNMSLNFKSQVGYDLNLAYNSFSKRLVRISNEVAGHFWERPFHSLNIVASKKYTAFKLSLKISNLLNQQVRIAHSFNEKYYTTQKYKPGRSFSIAIQFNN